MQEEFQDQTMNVQAFEECRKNCKTSLRLWKCMKSTGRISKQDSEMWNHAKSAGRMSGPDYECGILEKVQEEFQDQTMNVEVCEQCRKNFKTRL